MSNEENRPIFIQAPWCVEQIVIINRVLSRVKGPKKRKSLKLQKKRLIRFVKNHQQDINELFYSFPGEMERGSTKGR